VLQVEAMIRLLGLILTPATSICHIAASLDVPQVAMFTSPYENFLRWRPFTDKCRLLRADKYDSLERITVEQCLEAMESAISEYCRAPVVSKGR
jgi:ADP-heptose:LPS heptosyltransferase